MVQTIAVVFDRGGHGKLIKFYPRFNLNKTRLNFKEFSLEIPNTKFSVGSIVEHWGLNRVLILSPREANVTNQLSTVTLTLLKSSWSLAVLCG